MKKALLTYSDQNQGDSKVEGDSNDRNFIAYIVKKC